MTLPEPVPFKLLLCDGLNVLRRVYGANPAPDSTEKARQACRNAFSTFRRALAEHQPSHVLAPFDAGGHTWRHDIYPDYRINRDPMPEALRDELPAFRERLTRELGIPTVAVPGVEADDVINTVAIRWAERRNVATEPVVVLSTDKDLAVLLNRGALIRDHFAGEWRDEAWVQRKFGVPASLLADFLALMGDSSDGIPGVDGVGPKTASRLLLEHGSLEAVLQAASTLPIKGKLGEQLREQADIARLSRKLVEMQPDVNVGVAWKDLRYLAPMPMAA